MIILLIFLTVSVSKAWSADFDWYFSQSTGSDGGAGTEGSPWQTITKMKSQITGLANTDTATIHLKRGDTWTVGYTNGQISLPAANGIITITAYGAGNLPCFDGEIDFDNLPAINPYSNFYNAVFWIFRDGTTIEYIEMKNIYGRCIALWGSDDVTIQHCSFHDIGYDAIAQTDSVLSNIDISYNTMYHGQYLEKVGATSSTYAGFISFHYSTQGNDPTVVVSHNLMYDTFGEIINMNGGVAEYNILGTSRRSALFAQTGEGNYVGKPVIFRYNLVYGTTSSFWNETYSGGRYWSGPGINIQDEHTQGDNSQWTVTVYGNVVIGRGTGTHIYNNQAPLDDPILLVEVYNNLFIDNRYNIGIGPTTAFTECNIYNNAFIKYDTTGDVAGVWGTLSAGTDIDNNLLWITGGAPTYSSQFANNAVIDDPLLTGESKGVPVNWDGLTDWTDLDFDTDFLYPSDSGFVNTGKTLAGYEATMLAEGTNWDSPPGMTVVTGEIDDGGWDIGAIVTGVVVSGGDIFTDLGGGPVGESQIRTGGNTIEWEISGQTWDTDLGTDCAEMTAFIAGITEVGTPQTHGWDNEVASTITWDDFTLVSTTVLRLTLDAAVGFDPESNVTVRTIAPASSHSGVEAITSSPDIVISSDQPPSTGTGLSYNSNGKVYIRSANGKTITVGN